MALIERRQVIPLGNYQNGSRSFTLSSLADAATSIYIELARCTTATPTIWPNDTTTVALSIEVSFDGGANFQFVGGFTAEGGIIVQHNGAEGAITAFFCALPPGVSREARAQVTIVGGPLRTQGFIELRA